MADPPADGTAGGTATGGGAAGPGRSSPGGRGVVGLSPWVGIGVGAAPGAAVTTKLSKINCPAYPVPRDSPALPPLLIAPSVFVSA